MSEKHWNWGRDKLDGSSPIIKSVFCDPNSNGVYPQLSLPQTSVTSYYDSLNKCLTAFIERLDAATQRRDSGTSKSVLSFAQNLKREIYKVLDLYHSGFPSESFIRFERMMFMLEQRGRIPRTVQDGPRETSNELFRIRGVKLGEAEHCSAQDIFHVPSNLRNIIASQRYSIAGYPTLYLTDSLDLAYLETNKPPTFIASHFRVSSSRSLLDFGIRPDDFDFSENGGVKISEAFVNNYICWFPLLAACSFVRQSPKDTFSDEYVLPQMLMEWLRKHSRAKSESPKIKVALISNVKRNEYAKESSSVSHSFDYLDSLEKSLLDEFYNLRELIDSFPSKSPTETQANSAREEITAISHKIKAGARDAQSLMIAVAAECYLAEAEDSNSASEDILRFINLSSEVIGSLSECSRREAANSKRDVVQQQDFSREAMRNVGSARRYLRNGKRYLSFVVDDKRPRIVGIRYFSCKEQGASDLGRNYAFPAELSIDHSLAGGMERYSESLASSLQWSFPRLFPGNYESSSPAEKQRFIDKLLSDPQLTGTEALN